MSQTQSTLLIVILPTGLHSNLTLSSWSFDVSHTQSLLSVTHFEVVALPTLAYMVT